MSADVKLLSDQIRERERVRRRTEPLWGVFSFLLHVAVFAVIVLCTPVKELIVPKEKPAESAISAERIEAMSETLEAARLSELLRQIEDMQAVLHNMDVMKEELAKDYDAFAAKSAENIRSELDRLVNETAAAQKKSVEAQAVVKAATQELVDLETKANLAEKSVSEALQKKSDRLMYETVEKTNTAQANAVNALDKLQVKAAFAGYRKTAEAAEKLRDAQMEVGKMQDRAQTEAIETAHALVPIAGNAKFIADTEKRIAEAKTERAAAETKRAQAEKRLADETDAKKKAEAEQVACRKERKFDAAKKAQETAREHGRKLEQAKRESREAQRKESAAKHAEAFNAPRLAEAMKKRTELEKTRREKATAQQVGRLAAAQRAQTELNARLELLKATLAADTSELSKLAKGESRTENPLVNRAVPESIARAYELAKALEAAITESYKDVKATDTALAKRMSFDAAAKLTDVAKPERLRADVAALDAKPRTKADFDRQKAAEADVVREADTMVEATVAMMNDALEILWSGKTAKPETRDLEKEDGVKRLEARDFAARAEAGDVAARVKSLEREADFKLALENAAAEDSAAKAKDLAALMSATDDAARLKGVTSGPPELKGGDLALLPGNIIHVASDEHGGLPAKWMYVSGWYVIGPFPNPNRANLRRRFAPESVQDLDATYVGKDGRVLRWQFTEANNFDHINWWGGNERNAAEVIPPNKEEYAIYYAYTEVFFDRDCDRWVAIGSDDRSDVWLNDVPIWGSSNKLKAWTLAEDFRRVHFRKGRNRLLARIENGHWNFGWSVCISVEDARTTR